MSAVQYDLQRYERDVDDHAHEAEHCPSPKRDSQGVPELQRVVAGAPSQKPRVRIGRLKVHLWQVRISDLGPLRLRKLGIFHRASSTNKR